MISAREVDLKAVEENQFLKIISTLDKGFPPTTPTRSFGGCMGVTSVEFLFNL